MPRQHKPEAIQLLVGFESDKLQQLQRLMASGNCSGCPLHFLNEEWKGEMRAWHDGNRILPVRSQA